MSLPDIHNTATIGSVQSTDCFVKDYWPPETPPSPSISSTSSSSSSSSPHPFDIADTATLALKIVRTNGTGTRAVDKPAIGSKKIGSHRDRLKLRLLRNRVRTSFKAKTAVFRAKQARQKERAARKVL
ncbi:hypothetical protein CLAFUW4_02580 [Fulvia fulva]|uniref:Uncharacterized protein n=1 Tax=Passalora fulva TaxID=5499 RepID=A0A9Q8LBF4_PASFU|nr:uncharacterized protein CLAFUR5_02569 [Fulvia fulva]KAK4632293.1 hypothetical protein CLAFUR4_02575 [Fulvia fulva]KAK4633536.1 hypothetical protein CLAFUR0_02577 [Fulvia fulva]UJO14169.1 hypothetical protein CLAFUR5_02569 [Fulvia fulva]WPV11362.1 hypothetical protein CLAFUW4_02580 [Fulvia fulva]WPV25429.1 hypothetical protein CLAFUW7_02580 [Fulvia fulva]